MLKVGLALNCSIPEKAKFDRKNYFYPDLPKGYQISQYDLPFCKEGYLDIQSEFETRRIRVTRVHLEEDTGRLVHPEGANYSLVDFNRAGVPLMELVTEPDIQNAKEASEFAKQLQLILRYLGVSNADMEKGQMRVEVNISEKAAGSYADADKLALGTKVEIKNLNSFRVVEKAIAYEIQRQTEVLESGDVIIQETRGWDDVKGETYSQREKESAHEYRYFPEPDIPPFRFSMEEIEKLRAELPELPQQKFKRFQGEYGLTSSEIAVFVEHKDFGEFFEKTISELEPNLPQEKLRAQIKLAANYFLSDLLGALENASITSEDFLISPENFAELIELIDNATISSAIAKQVLKEMFQAGKDPSQIIADRGLTQIVDTAAIENIAKEIIAQNQKAADDFKKGTQIALQFLVGQMMAKSKGTVSPDLANQILRKLLT